MKWQAYFLGGGGEGIKLIWEQQQEKMYLILIIIYVQHSDKAAHQQSD